MCRCILVPSGLFTLGCEAPEPALFPKFPGTTGPSVTPDILGLAEAEAVEAGRAGEPTVVNHLNPQGMSGFREHRGTGHKRRHTSGTQVELRVSVNKRGIIPRN